MDATEQEALKARYVAAVDAFVGKVKTDPSVIAVIVCGSLAYDLLGEKSDVDMTVVIRDQIVKDGSYSVIEDGILINVGLMTRSDFRRVSERSPGGSIFQSVFAKGTVVYSIDESFTEFFEQQKALGEDDIALSVFYTVGELIAITQKAAKYLRVKRDCQNAQYFLLKAAEIIARIELCLVGEPVSRRALQRALEIHPEVVLPFYTEAMSHVWGEAEVAEKIATLDAYISGLVGVFKKPVLELMADQEIKTSTVIAKHFHIEAHFIISVFEYLADKGVIERASRTIRPTPKGKPAVEEIGYLYVP